jgi:hypothetical protein
MLNIGRPRIWYLVLPKIFTQRKVFLNIFKPKKFLKEFLVEKRKQDIISWKRGAWVDDNDISYKNPNDCWKKLIANHFGEIGLKKFYGQNVWGKTGRLIAITNRGNIFDINKNPMRVIMDLEKCKGSYCGREFSSYKEEDFIQMI